MEIVPPRMHKFKGIQPNAAQPALRRRGKKESDLRAVVAFRPYEVAFFGVAIFLFREKLDEPDFLFEMTLDALDCFFTFYYQVYNPL